MDFTKQKSEFVFRMFSDLELNALKKVFREKD